MSKQIPLTQGKFAIVDDEDYEQLSCHKWYAFNHHCTFYAVRGSSRQKGKRTIIFMHREILGLGFGDQRQCDHRNGNGLDNGKTNLRMATSTQNNQNRRPRKGTSSRFKGVYWDRGRAKWRAKIRINGPQINLGRFDSEIDGAKAYDAAAVAAFGEFARINFGDMP